MKKSIIGLLLFIGMSSSLVAGNFSRDNTKEVVVDSATNLMWQDNADAKTVQKDWKDAIDYCEALSLGGYIDWHLPNYNELWRLADRSRYSPAIDKTFQNIVSDFYWSSTTFILNSDYGWVVLFHNGGSDFNKKSTIQYIRCVRDNN